MTVLPSKNLHLAAGVGGRGELINHNYKNCFAGKVQSVLAGTLEGFALY